MSPAFFCRLQYNSDIPKIRKFFEDTETINIAAGTSGIAFLANTSNDVCYFIVEIHTCDLYQLSVQKDASPIWKNGGIVRSLPAISFLTFIKNKEVNDDLAFEINAEGTELKVSVLDGMNEVRSTVIHLVIPKVIYEYPSLTYANAIIKVNEFKKLCSDMSKSSYEIQIESQKDAIRLKGKSTAVNIFGTWKEGEKHYSCSIKNTAFIKATKINIGNTKNSQAGIYVVPDHPVMIKVKLGIINFLIYSKTWNE